MIHSCYSPAYSADTPTASMRKLPIVAEAVKKSGLAELHDPGTIDPELLRKLHHGYYVDAFLNGVEPLASSQGWLWTPQIREGVLAIQAGQLLGAQLALEHGIAANIAQGFHHALPDRGMGYCTFNGLALVAQEFPDLRVGVLDCDEHQGNGTAAFTRLLPNLYNFTLFGSTFGAEPTPRSVHRWLGSVGHDFKIYSDVLEEAFAQLLHWEIDLLLYQAGADPHEDDPLGRLNMTTAQLLQRDHLVFAFCKKHKLPVLFVLAGGYQEPIETCLAPLHVNTFRATVECFG